LQELVDGAVAAHHVGVGAVLDEVLQLLAAAVEHVRQAQALADAQLFGEIEHRARRRPAGEDVIGDRTEAEDVQAGAVLRLGLRGFRRQIDQAGVLDVLLDVHGAADRAPRRVDGVAALCVPSRVPVCQFMMRGRGVAPATS
jgi:hypothetical protein